jgi:hypothetical protein
MIQLSEFLVDESPPGQPRFDEPQAAAINPAAPGPVKLENRGVTSQSYQSLLWARQTIHKNSVAAKLREFGQVDDADKLEKCHSIFTVAVCSGCNHVQKFPNRCDQFFCPECQPRLSQDRKKAVEWWTHEVHQPKHVTLTVKNVADMTKAHVLEFRSWFSKLRRSKFARNWNGGFYSLEVTNEGNGWHLHLHALVDAGWIDSIQLSQEWSRVTGGMGRIVKVKDARGQNYLAEVTKYAVKGVALAAWSGQNISRFIEAFRGVRTFGVFGSLYGKRTEFSEWFKTIRDMKPNCKCGCNQVRYYSESEFLELDLVPTNTNVAPIPPPQIQHPELFNFAPGHCLDAIKR